MASVNVAKFTTSGARGLSVHFDSCKRVELEHENPHIQKDLTERNYWMGAKSYNEVLYKLKERQVALDKVKPPKRLKADRITCLAVEIPIPRELTDRGQADAFIQDAYAVLERTFGRDNVQGMTVHKDEVHDYIDPQTKEVRTSLEHAHAFVTPEDSEKGLNAKACLNRQKLRDLQHSMNDMCLERYGMEYNTHELARNLSVEQLKNQSLRAEKEVLQHQIDDNRLIISQQSQQFEHNKQTLEAQNKTIKRHNQELDAFGNINARVSEIADKKIWSADDKDYMLKLAVHADKNQTLMFDNQNLKRDKKKLTQELEGVNKTLKSTQEELLKVEKDNLSLKYENSKISRKLSHIEDFIHNQGLELPKPEIEISSMRIR